MSTASSSTMYIPLSRPQTSRSRSSSRRYPLTPSTVTPPAISHQYSSATRHEGGKAMSPTNATSLLSKVVSSPTSRRCTPSSSPLPSPSEKDLAGHYPQYHAVVHQGDAQPTPRYAEEAIKYWGGHQQRDGYISFPDFERFSYDQDDRSGQRDCMQQTAKT